MPSPPLLPTLVPEQLPPEGLIWNLASGSRQPVSHCTAIYPENRRPAAEGPSYTIARQWNPDLIISNRAETASISIAPPTRGLPISQYSRVPTPPPWLTPSPWSTPHPRYSGSVFTHRNAELQYQDIRGSQFRLIRIPVSMSTIKCHLITVSLERHPEYVAVSYAWGDIDDTVEIYVNGSPFNITSSLYDALSAIRRKGDVLMWADALCINQKNKEEQSWQVQLMAHIYMEAEFVVAWLGPEAEDSSLALDLLQEVSEVANQPEAMDKLIASTHRQSHFTALVHLFERDYWRRLWIVQEVLNARSVRVLCGTRSLPWKTYTDASEAFKLERHSRQLDRCFPGWMWISQQRLPYATILGSLGPASIHDLRIYKDAEANSLLEVLRACRQKLTSEPKDKVFGVFGILPKDVRDEFSNYSASMKEVYINVVDYILRSTGRLDVICEAIYYPTHTSVTTLPSWVPDWSHITQIGALGLSFDFSASRNRSVEYSFSDPKRRTKLQISAISLGRVNRRGNAVGTLGGLGDPLMAFLHWRAVLLGQLVNQGTESEYTKEAFCQTLCLEQKTGWAPKEWVKVCYHVFSSLIRERLPRIPLDEELSQHADMEVGVLPNNRRPILQDNCTKRMMGRCFFVTDEGQIGMGTGFMDPGDIVCVPLGCSTPILLRPEANEYRYIGDAYVYNYMQGRAIDEYDEGKRSVRKYVLH